MLLCGWVHHLGDEMTGFNSKRQMAQDKVAQPAQEPVKDDFFKSLATKNPSPDQRPWVGLTDEELPAMWTDAVRKAALPPNKSALIHYKDGIEQSLKEKNCG